MRGALPLAATPGGASRFGSGVSAPQVANLHPQSAKFNLWPSIAAPRLVHQQIKLFSHALPKPKNSFHPARVLGVHAHVEAQDGFDAGRNPNEIANRFDRGRIDANQGEETARFGSRGSRAIEPLETAFGLGRTRDVRKLTLPDRSGLPEIVERPWQHRPPYRAVDAANATLRMSERNQTGS